MSRQNFGVILKRQKKPSSYYIIYIFLILVKLPMFGCRPYPKKLKRNSLYKRTTQTLVQKLGTGCATKVLNGALLFYLAEERCRSTMDTNIPPMSGTGSQIWSPIPLSNEKTYLF